MDLFGIKAFLNRAIQQTALDFSNTAAANGLYNEKLFAWINDNQPIFWEDNPANYVQNGYQGNGDVFTCVNKILNKLASCPLVLYSVKKGQEANFKKYKTLMRHDFAKAELFKIQTKGITEIYIDNLNNLVENPNPDQTTTEWLKQWGGFYLLTGNSYNYYNGVPGSKKWTEMYVLPSPLINIVSGGELMPVKGYNVFNSINYRNGVPDFPADSVSHLKTFNPHFSTYGSQLYGQSPLRAYILTLVANRDGRIEQNKQLKNGGLMGILSPKIGAPNINDPKIKADLRQKLAEAKGSSDLLSRIFVSGAPVDWTQIGLASVDLQILEALGMNRVDIANAFDVPIQVLNNTEAQTDNNMLWAMKQFIYNPVMGLGSAISDKLTRDTCKPYNTDNEKVVWMFDYSALPELAEDLGQIATALNTMYWITPNEKREFQGFGRSTEPDADSILVPKIMGRLADISLLDSTFTNAGNGITP